MRLLVSTTVRHVTPDERSGHLYTVDIDAHKVMRCSKIVEPPFRVDDTNHRGGMRGSKGIAVRSDMIAISNFSSVFLYTPNWELIRKISHPSCSSIHDIVFYGDKLFVTSARNDLLFEFDVSGELVNYIDLRQGTIRDVLQWFPPTKLSAEQVIEGAIAFRDPRTHELETYDNAHVNSVCITDGDDILISLGLILESRFLNLLRVKRWLKKMGMWNILLSVNRVLRKVLRKKKKLHSDLVVQPAKGRSVVVRLTQKKEVQPLLVFDDKIVPSHSLLPVSNRCVVYLDTTNGHVVEFDPVDKNILASTKITEGFLRGAYLLSSEKIVLGSTGDLLVFDLAQRQIVSSFRLTNTPHESVFDIQYLPEHYAVPPEKFYNASFSCL